MLHTLGELGQVTEMIHGLILYAGMTFASIIFSSAFDLATNGPTKLQLELLAQINFAHNLVLEQFVRSALSDNATLGKNVGAFA